MTDESASGTTPDAETWNRGDGQPEPRLLDETIDCILQVCNPTEIILFGSGARGELRDDSDLDLLIVVADDATDHRDTVRRIHAGMDDLPRADMRTATRTRMREAARSLATLHRTIATEGVTLYRNSRRLPYLRRPRPAPDHTLADPKAARVESADLARLAAERLKSAHETAEVRERMRPSPSLDACDRTRIAGDARKALEFAFQAVIVCAARRPYAWKNPAGLASEARTAGAEVPDTDPAALERAGKHHTGLPFPGDPAPTEDDVRETLALAERIVPWAQETVRKSQGEATAADADTNTLHNKRHTTGPTRCC